MAWTAKARAAAAAARRAHAKGSKKYRQAERVSFQLDRRTVRHGKKSGRELHAQKVLVQDYLRGRAMRKQHGRMSLGMQDSIYRSKRVLATERHRRKIYGAGKVGRLSYKDLRKIYK